MELFFYTLLYITVGVAYFYVAVVSGNAVQLVGIDSPLPPAYQREGIIIDK